MRKVTFGGGNSLDNYIAGPGESIDWLQWSDDAAKISAESFQGVDTILMGRKTFQFAERMGQISASTTNMRTIVFSSTLENVPEGIELVQKDAVEFVRELKLQKGGSIIVMGGGQFGGALLEGGVIDEVGFNIHPLLLGGGIPLFWPTKRRIELELIEARAIQHGCVLVRYRVTN